MALKKMSQIRKQMAKLEREAARLKKTAVREVVNQIKALMNHYGVSLEDIQASLVTTEQTGTAARKRAASPTRAAKRTGATGTKKRTTRAKPQPKYRSATDPSLTWTGRGRTPRWVKEWVDSGKPIEELLI